MEFWDEKRQLFIRDLREKEKVYDSAALYIDPILEYIEKRNKNGLIVKIKKHILSQINGLKKKADSRIMLKRYEGDVWLGNEKVWTLSTLIGAYSCIKLASFLRERKDKDWEIFLKEGKQLLDTTIDIKFLPEQLTEDGNADSANPLGWSHAMRILTIKGLSKFQ
jgi:GH15 family glucan-1,4-alpha-glucosidase